MDLKIDADIISVGEEHGPHKQRHNHRSTTASIKSINRSVVSSGRRSHATSNGPGNELLPSSSENDPGSVGRQPVSLDRTAGYFAGKPAKPTADKFRLACSQRVHSAGKQSKTGRRHISKAEIFFRSKTSLERLFGKHRGQLLRFCFSIPFVALGVCALLCYLFTRIWIRVVCYLGLEQRVRSLRSKLNRATTVEEYEAIARELDKVSGCHLWKLEPKSSCYDWRRVGTWTKALREYREARKFHRVCELLSTIQHLKFGRVFSENCYSRCHWGTKVAIEEFLVQVEEAVATTLELLQSESFTQENYPHYGDVLRFVEDFSSRWGKTALYLSGGGMIGFHHFGVGKALLQNDVVPKVLIGCSAGSAVASWLATRNQNEAESELDGHMFARLFAPFEQNSLFSKFMNFVYMGHLCLKDSWITCAKRIFADTTMIEAYEKTGRILNISACRADELTSESSGPYILNYKSAPNVLLLSAILASSAFPLLTAPFTLIEKAQSGDTKPSSRFSTLLFRDGCLTGDIPTQQITREFDIGFSIVCQVNPHVYPFLGLQSGCRAGRPARSQLVKHGAKILNTLGLMESFFREVMASIVRLGISLDVWPSIKGIDSLLLYDQTYKGDITLLPRRIFWQHRLAATNIVRDKDVSWYLNEGMVMTFEKIPLIRARMRLEKLIEACMTEVRTLLGNQPEYRAMGRAVTSLGPPAKKGDDPVKRYASDSVTTARMDPVVQTMNVVNHVVKHERDQHASGGVNETILETIRRAQSAAPFRKRYPVSPTLSVRVGSTSELETSDSDIAANTFRNSLFPLGTEQQRRLSKRATLLRRRISSAILPDYRSAELRSEPPCFPWKGRLQSHLNPSGSSDRHPSSASSSPNLPDSLNTSPMLRESVENMASAKFDHRLEAMME